MKFDRTLQNELLSVCVEAYPSHTEWQSFNTELSQVNDIKLSANIVYLKEQGLISIRDQRSDDPFSFLDNMRATVKGIDFLLHDGGISAILNVKTIKFHRDAVVVLEDLIALSGLSVSETEIAKSKLAELSSESLKTIIQSITSAGISLLTKC